MALKIFNKLTKLPQWELPPPKRLKWTQKHIKYAWWDIYSFKHCHKYSLSSFPGIPQPEVHSCFFQKATSPSQSQSSRPVRNAWSQGVADSARDIERASYKFHLEATAAALCWHQPQQFLQWRGGCLWKCLHCNCWTWKPWKQPLGPRGLQTVWRASFFCCYWIWSDFLSFLFLKATGCCFFSGCCLFSLYNINNTCSLLLLKITSDDRSAGTGSLDFCFSEGFLSMHNSLWKPNSFSLL